MNPILLFIFSFFIGGLTILFFWYAFLRSFYYAICRHKRGIQTEAEIVYLLDSLIKVQYQPLFYIQFRFYIDDKEVTTDKIKMLIKKSDVNKYRKGQFVQIKYDSKNLKNIKMI